MRKLFAAFRRDDSGAAMAEYAILVALIALVAVAGITLAGEAIGQLFTDISTCLKDMTTANCS